MGINADGFDLISKAVQEFPRGITGASILELGNQMIREPHRQAGPAKHYFEKMGACHTSVDINGKDGALKLDLNSPLVISGGPFDLVTNFGTSEHVENQKSVFENIHYHCAEGGVMIHQVPLIHGKWKNHGLYEYTADKFRRLAYANNYDILHLEEGPRDLVHVIFKKRGFVWVSPAMS
jgi:hypothetical protein